MGLSRNFVRSSRIQNYKVLLTGCLSLDRFRYTDWRLRRRVLLFILFSLCIINRLTYEVRHDRIALPGKNDWLIATVDVPQSQLQAKIITFAELCVHYFSRQ